MSTEKQRKANRANSKRSTGPRTKSGKARSSSNARTHGLAARVDTEAILTWMRIILDDPGLTYGDILAGSELINAAFDLADAEVRYMRTIKLYDKVLSVEYGCDEPTCDAPTDAENSDAYSEADFHKLVDTIFGRDVSSSLSRPKRERPDLGTITKHLNAADGRRRRAFARWVGCLEAQRETESRKRTQIRV